MKTYVFASSDVLEGKLYSLYISYATLPEIDPIRIIWVFHSRTLTLLNPTTWEEIKTKIPNIETIQFEGDEGTLFLSRESGLWGKYNNGSK